MIIVKIYHHRLYKHILVMIILIVIIITIIIMSTIDAILHALQYEQRSQEWYKVRQNYLTSSDIASVLGLNPYQTRKETLLKKCGESEPFLGNEAVSHGQKYEQEAIDIYSDLTGRVSYNVGLIPYTELNTCHVIDDIDCSFLAGSADSISILKDEITECNTTDTGISVIEVKCPFRRRIKYDVIPEYYYPQLQMNLHILNVTVGDYIEYVPCGHFGRQQSLMNIVRVFKDDTWFRNVLPELHSFWNDVLERRHELAREHCSRI